MYTQEEPDVRASGRMSGASRGAGCPGQNADRGKGVPSFDEMMDIALVEVDFDDPTTNVR